MKNFINKIIHGDCRELLKTLPDNSIDCCVTSPPYFGLKDYGHEAQIGHEATPDEFVKTLINVFEEVKRVLKREGTLWLNLGDSYGGSGRGLDADGTWNPGKGGYMQQTHRNNKSQMSARKVNDNSLSKKAIETGAIGNRWVKPPQGFKAKDLIGVPWMVAFALRADGWYLRQDIIWHKPNPMPESVTDRCTKNHEYIFLLSKSNRYYFDYESIQEIATGFDGIKDTMMKGSEKYKNSVIPGQEEHTMASQGHERWKFKGTGTFGNQDAELNGLHSGNKYNPKFKNLQPDGQQPNTMHIKRAEGEADEVYPIRNKRSVWTVNTKPYADSHFATFPEKLIEDCILAGCPKGGIVLDPFMGAGTTAVVSKKLGRNFIGFELNKSYIAIAEKRMFKEFGMFHESIIAA